jgi:hypothetical protein
LFAGLLGFLISEKFGIELVDSGDFYIALMYGIFFIFSTRPFLKIMGKNFSLHDLVILKAVCEFVSTM